MLFRLSAKITFFLNQVLRKRMTAILSNQRRYNQDTILILK